MISFIWKILPSNYRWTVAIKKASYTIAKLWVAGLLALGIGEKVDAEQLKAFQEGLALVIAGGLEVAHDWAKLKYPNAKWL